MARVKYVDEDTHVPAYRVWYYAMKKVDFRQPIIIVGKDKDGELYVASTHGGKTANSLMAKAMDFLKIN